MSTAATAKTATLISSVEVFSSGWGAQHDEHRFGTWKPRLWWALTSRSWNKIPLNYFLITHRNGPVLFDTGLDPAIVTDPNYISSAIGRFLLRRIFQLHIMESDRLDRILAKSGFDASDVRLAVMSHLHFDHVGGIGVERVDRGHRHIHHLQAAPCVRVFFIHIDSIDYATVLVNHARHPVTGLPKDRHAVLNGPEGGHLRVQFPDREPVI